MLTVREIIPLIFYFLTCANIENTNWIMPDSIKKSRWIYFLKVKVLLIVHFISKFSYFSPFFPFFSSSRGVKTA